MIEFLGILNYAEEQLSSMDDPWAIEILHIFETYLQGLNLLRNLIVDVDLAD